MPGECARCREAQSVVEDLQVSINQIVSGYDREIKRSVLRRTLRRGANRVHMHSAHAPWEEKEMERGSGGGGRAGGRSCERASVRAGGVLFVRERGLRVQRARRECSHHNRALVCCCPLAHTGCPRSWSARAVVLAVTQAGRLSSRTATSLGSPRRCVTWAIATCRALRGTHRTRVAPTSTTRLLLCTGVCACWCR
jgi:hypothetical protein